MENTVFVSLSHQMALKRQMEIIANNIANQSTNSFKSEKALFEEYLLPTSGGKEVSYVQDYGTLRNTEEGTFQTTNNSFDMAIHGRGYFVLETPFGNRFTRNGHFQRNQESELVTTDGRKVLDDQNDAIVIDPALGEFSVSPDGTIATSAGPIARLQIVEFENEQKMRKVAAGVYRTDERPVDEDEMNSTVLQYTIEASNVKPILEMTNMIYVQRSYSSSQRVSQTDHEIQRKMIGKLGGAD